MVLVIEEAFYVLISDVKSRAGRGNRMSYAVQKCKSRSILRNERIVVIHLNGLQVAGSGVASMDRQCQLIC